MTGVTPRSVGPLARLVRCDNPGVLELEGTNTWLLAAPSAECCVLVDPGPADHPEHQRALALATADVPVALILLTHSHPDHAGAVAAAVAWSGAPVRAFSPEHCRDAEPLADGEVFDVAGLRITVVHTPGHTADSVCFVARAARQRVVLTGDTVMGSGTSMLEAQPGALGTYLRSLDALAQLGRARLLPGHGPDHPEVAPVVARYRAHRHTRLEQVRGYLTHHRLHPHEADARSLARSIYRDLDSGLLDAATTSVRAQLLHLASVAG